MQNCYFCLNNSATLNIYINPKIFDSIINSLIQTDEMRSSMLYKKLVNELKKHFSYTTFDNHLKRLIEIGYVNKREETTSNYNISPIYYSLTNKGKKDYNLEILEIPHLINKNRILYQLLLFFDCYKRSNILSERQFKDFLKEIGIKFENMEQMDLETLKHIQDNIFSNVTNGYRTYNNISIAEYRNSSNSSKYYYVILPGFTIQEFLDYLKLIKKGKEPQPFAQFPTRIQIPYIHYKKFSKEEVTKAIELLKINGIIRPILDIYRGEMRYDICNDSMKNILSDYWFLHIFDFHISFQKLVV